MKRRLIDALAWAIEEAAANRGLLVPAQVEACAEFDAKIAAAREALREIRKESRAKKRPKAEYVSH